MVRSSRLASETYEVPRSINMYDMAFSEPLLLRINTMSRSTNYTPYKVSCLAVPMFTRGQKPTRPFADAPLTMPTHTHLQITHEPSRKTIHQQRQPKKGNIRELDEKPCRGNNGARRGTSDMDLGPAKHLECWARGLSRTRAVGFSCKAPQAVGPGWCQIGGMNRRGGKVSCMTAGSCMQVDPGSRFRTDSWAL